MKKKFTNLRLIQNEKNLGRIQNWNISIEKAQGKYLIFLFANDLINEKNNIHELIQNLDSDQTISICMSALLKKEKSGQYIKKAYFDEIIKCPSKKFASNCLNRGLLPFGPIQSIIYRLDDIANNKNKFLEEFPINADEIFSFEEACKRENIMFNPHPQITWDLTHGRFHGKVKIEDEFKEHTDTIEIVKSKTNLDVNYGLISTYRAINLIKFSAKNFQQKNGKKEAIIHLLSKIKESGSFFNTDKILIKTLFDKLKNSDRTGFMFDQPHLQDNVLNIVDEPGNNLVESMDEILFGKNFGIISDIEFGPDGALYVISLSEGTIYKIISNVR